MLSMKTGIFTGSNYVLTDYDVLKSSEVGFINFRAVVQVFEVLLHVKMKVP